MVIKERLSKRYRVQELDTRITKQRLIQVNSQLFKIYEEKEKEKEKEIKDIF